MARTGRPVYKHDNKGELVAEYISVKEASAAERMQPCSMYEAIECGGPVKGFRFSWNKDSTLPSNDIPPPDGPEPWEDNGYFNVRKWGKAFIY